MVWFFVDIGFLVWEKGYSTVNSPCFTCNVANDFLEFDFNFFYQNIIFIYESKNKTLVVKSKENKNSKMNL